MIAARRRPPRAATGAGLALALAWAAAAACIPGAGAQARPRPPASKRPGGAPPSAAAIRPTLLRNFSDDQAAVWRYRHVERVVIDKNHHLEDRTVRLDYVHGHEVPMVLAINGRPLQPAALAGQRAAARKRAQAMAKRPPAPRGGLVFNHKFYSFARLANDYVYGQPSARQWHGRLTWVYPASPNPAVHSRSRAEQILLASRGAIWVDAGDLHVCRIEVATFQPVRYWLGFLATVHNAGLDLELERHAPGRWLPAYAHFWANATILLFKSFSETKTQRFSDWQLRKR